MASIEAVSEIPVSFTVFPSAKKELYRFQDYLLAKVDDEEVRLWFSWDLDNLTVVKYFTVVFWCSQEAFKGLVKLSKSQDRTVEKFLPSRSSSRRASEEGYMVSEYLIVLAPKFFQLPKHEMKTGFRASRWALAVRDIMKKEFTLEYLQEGHIYVSFTLKAQRKKRSICLLESCFIEH